MRFSSRAARRRRGTPLWAYLTALVVVPLLGVVALTGAIVRIAVDEAGSAARSEAAIGALARLHAVRSAVIREIVPTLTLVIIESPDSATILGTGSELVTGLRDGARALLEETRSATDEAFDDIRGDSVAAAGAAAAARRIGWVREAADDAGADPTALYDDFLALADDLAGRTEPRRARGRRRARAGRHHCGHPRPAARRRLRHGGGPSGPRVHRHAAGRSR